jgi:hypothetical protein
MGTTSLEAASLCIGAWEISGQHQASRVDADSTDTMIDCLLYAEPPFFDLKG